MTGSEAIAEGAGVDSSFPPIEVFTTPRRRVPVPTRPPTRRPPPVVVASSPRPNNPFPFDTNNLGRRRDKPAQPDLNSPSKLAIIIPTAIVGVWLLLLLVIGLVVCCRRRSSRKRLRSNYDPAFHMRHANYPSREPNPAPQGRKHKANGGSGYPPVHSSYEDHLEKAARLSEMSQYSSQQPASEPSKRASLPRY